MFDVLGADAAGADAMDGVDGIEDLLEDVVVIGLSRAELWMTDESFAGRE